MCSVVWLGLVWHEIFACMLVSGAAAGAVAQLAGSKGRAVLHAHRCAGAHGGKMLLAWPVLLSMHVAVRCQVLFSLDHQCTVRILASASLTPCSMSHVWAVFADAPAGMPALVRLWLLLAGH
jgi:hypothetical protein